MNKELKYLILFSLLTLFGCGNEEDAVSGIVPPQAGETLQLTVSAADFVTDGAPDTRATDDGNRTTFDEGDRVGVIILDEGGNLLYDNIPYVYQNNKWTFDSSNDDGKGGCYYDPKAKTYIVYYPYSRAADEVRSKKDLKTIFAPKFNQSDIKDYRSSDLMVWDNSSLTPPVTTLNAELEHAFASICLAPTVDGVILDDGNLTRYTGSYASEVTDISNISDVSLTIDNTVYVPFHATDGSLRCIVPAGITPGDIRCFYTIGGKTYGNTIKISGTGEVVVNTRYACKPAIGDVTYSLGNAHIGDFYCKRSSDGNGYLIPGDVDITADPKPACLGIVMKVGKDDAGSWMDNCLYKLKDNKTPMDIIHGYVLALYDANDGKTCQWGSFGKEVKTNKEPNTGFYGYKNTQTIINYDKSNGNNLQNNFPATYHATTGYEGIYPAPNNSSGWFLPSAGQCWYWFGKKDEIWTSMNKAVGNGWSNYYWSSSEDSYYPKTLAWYVRFNDGRVYYDRKDGRNSVRSCLAF